MPEKVSGLTKPQMAWLGGHWWLWRSVPQRSYASHWTKHILLSQTDETVVLFQFIKTEVIKDVGLGVAGL